jgi:hypothetical protein
VIFPTPFTSQASIERDLSGWAVTFLKDNWVPERLCEEAKTHVFTIRDQLKGFPYTRDGFALPGVSRSVTIADVRPALLAWAHAQMTPDERIGAMSDRELLVAIYRKVFDI